MKKLFGLNALVMSLAVLLAANNASAQQCPAKYSKIPSNKQYVQRALIDATNILARMKSLAYLGSISAPVVNLGLFTQRAAINSEYVALRMEIDNLGNPNVNFLRPRTVQFLNAVLNTQNMGLAGTNLLGATQTEAETNSSAAEAASSQALADLWKCF